MSTTALQVVNRLRRLLREPDVAAFAPADELTTALLDRVNDAMDTILNQRIWTFQIRHDGSFLSVGSESGTAATLLQGNTNGTITDWSGENWILGSRTLLDPEIRVRSRLVVTALWNAVSEEWDAIEQSESPVALTEANATTGTIRMERRWPEASGSHAWTVYANEYRLPSTVRQVLSVRHSEQPLTLHQMDATFDFYSLGVRAHDYIGQDPTDVYIGGRVTPTSDRSTDPVTTYEPGTGLTLFPIPSAETIISYSYVENATRFTAITDTLDATPDNVVDLIVDLAYARAQMTGIGNEPTIGFQLEARILGRGGLLGKTYAAYTVDPYRTTQIDRLDRLPGGMAGPRWPGRTVESL